MRGGRDGESSEKKCLVDFQRAGGKKSAGRARRNGVPRAIPKRTSMNPKNTKPPMALPHNKTHTGANKFTTKHEKSRTTPNDA